MRCGQAIISTSLREPGFFRARSNLQPSIIVKIGVSGFCPINSVEDCFGLRKPLSPRNDPCSSVTKCVFMHEASRLTFRAICQTDLCPLVPSEMRESLLPHAHKACSSTPRHLPHTASPVCCTSILSFAPHRSSMNLRRSQRALALSGEAGGGITL